MDKRTLVLGLILLVAAFVRLYKIEHYTQFLGDQGSAGVIVYEAFRDRTIPLVGPAVSTGQRPGPFYYYLIALPLLLTHYNPVAPAIVFALLGVFSVYLIYRVTLQMFGAKSAIVSAGCYAFSPAIIAQNRNMWNPTSIPFFVILLFLSFYKVHCQRKYHFFLLTLFSLAALVQLHYTNIFYLLFLFIFWFYEVIIANRNHETGRFLLWSLGGIGIFILTLLPFIYFESIHEFVDIRELLLMFLFPQTSISGGDTISGAMEVLIRLSSILIPTEAYIIKILIIIVVTICAFINRANRWGIFFVFLFIFGLLFMSFYKGNLFEHYLFFLYPLPFFLLAGFNSFLLNKGVSAKIITAFFMGLISLVYLPGILKLQVTQADDIPRTREAVREIIGMNQEKTFSFALIASPSFSDYHYRFFFTIFGKYPVDVMSQNYKNLFLVCEYAGCPPAENLSILKQFRPICWDHHCKPEYPQVSLEPFSLVQVIVKDRYSIYALERK